MAGADPGFFPGGGALVSCSNSTPINHIVFFLQNTSCIRKPQVISGGGGEGEGAHPLHSPPRSAPGWSLVFLRSHRFSSTSRVLSIAFHSSFSNSLIIHKENTKDECLEILSWTTKKHKKTLSRPLYSKLKKIRGLFKDLLRNMEKWISRTRPKIHTLREETLRSS